MVIAKADKPVARVSPFEPTAGPRRLGSARSLGRVAHDFDASMPDE